MHKAIECTFFFKPFLLLSYFKFLFVLPNVNCENLFLHVSVPHPHAKQGDLPSVIEECASMKESGVGANEENIIRLPEHDKSESVSVHKDNKNVKIVIRKLENIIVTATDSLLLAMRNGNLCNSEAVSLKCDVQDRLKLKRIIDLVRSMEELVSDSKSEKGSYRRKRKLSFSRADEQQTGESGEEWECEEPMHKQQKKDHVGKKQRIRINLLKSPLKAWSRRYDTPKAILNKLGVKRKCQLSPHRRSAYDSFMDVSNGAVRYVGLASKYKGELVDIKNGEDKLIREKLSDSLSPTMCRLICSNVKKASNNNKKIMWSLDEKLDSLHLYKTSPKCYRVLRTVMALPCPRTLQQVLSNLQLRPGINEQVFEHLRILTSGLNIIERTVCLSFDETKIKEMLVVNRSVGVIDGFEDFGPFGRTHRIATHTLIFMIHGVDSNWKMPIAFTYAHNTTRPEIIKQLLVALILKLFNININVLSTVCDMGSTNRTALKLLGVTIERPYFELNGKRIYCLNDASHLLKNTRTGIKKNGLQIQGKYVKWDHIVEYKRYDESRDLPELDHIGPVHFNFQWRETQKVKFAAQILSETYGKGMVDAAKEGQISPDAAFSGGVLRLINAMFDTMNSNLEDDNDSQYKNAVTDGSEHLKVWEDLKRWVQQWNFVDRKGTVIPTRNGWIMNLTAFPLIWNELSSLGLKKLATKFFSQDCLENLNGLVKSCCGSNPEPNVAQFEAAFKTVLITNKHTPHLQKGCCENDNAEMLTNLRPLLENKQSCVATNTTKSTIIQFTRNLQEGNVNANSINVRKMYNKIKKFVRCDDCIKSISTPAPQAKTVLVKGKKTQPRKKSRLPKPSTYFGDRFLRSAACLQEVLPQVSSKMDLRDVLIETINRIVPLDFPPCSKIEHKDVIKELFIEAVVFYGMLKFCKQANLQHKAEKEAKRANSKK